ncbi:hypothetical protein [Paenibacillus sp. SI8]|uniref:hypothetical protein n=1 Tax=unclassified Paenibacillus TaxID=185978 RepID=UPI0034658497
MKGPDTDGWWSLKNNDGYAFQIKAGEKTSKTFWNGALANEVNLAASPIAASEAKLPPLFSLSDMRMLLGATTAYNDKVVYGDKNVTLSSREYEISGFNLPAAADGTELHLSGLLYENLSLDDGALSPDLQILVKSRYTDEKGPTNIQLAKVNHLYNLGYNFGVYDVTLHSPLKAGTNHISLVFKIGERIFYKKDWDVTAPAQK